MALAVTVAHKPVDATPAALGRMPLVGPKTVEAQGTIAAVSPAPKPGTVPYKDHIVSVHLVDIESTEPKASGGQALVYMRSMRDNVWTRAARYRTGERLNLTLQAWTDVEKKYGGINRSELGDEDLELEDPCWGEEVKR